MPETRSLVKVPAMQTDATLSQANPVSTTLYEVLPLTRNVKLIGIGCNITWAVTQPTPLEVIVTIDGISYVFIQANPVSTTWYYPLKVLYANEANQAMTTTSPITNLPYLLEGRQVRVQVRLTWATTQPTPLACRVKYATW